MVLLAAQIRARVELLRSEPGRFLILPKAEGLLPDTRAHTEDGVLRLDVLGTPVPTSNQAAGVDQMQAAWTLAGPSRTPDLAEVIHQIGRRPFGESFCNAALKEIGVTDTKHRMKLQLEAAAGMVRG